MSTVRWRRIAGAFPWWTTALLAGFITLQSLFWWEWLARELPPLERYYLPAYFHATEDARHPGKQTRIDPLFKTALSRKRALVVASDVVFGKAGDLPVQLSPSAIEQGWTGIEKGPPLRDDSAAVEELLRDGFYQSRGFWELAAEPLLYSCVFLLVSIISALFNREELTAEWRSLWAALSDSEMRPNYDCHSPAHRSGIVSGFRLLWELSKLAGKLRLRHVNPAAQPSRSIHACRNRIDSSSSESEPQSASVACADSECFQQADSGLERTVKSSGNGSRRDAGRRRIFPEKAEIRTPHEKPEPWNESQWID